MSLINSVNAAESLNSTNLQGATSVCLFHWNSRKVSVPREAIDAQFARVPTLKSVYVGNNPVPITRSPIIPQNRQYTHLNKVLTEATKNRLELAKIREQTIKDLQALKPATEIAHDISEGMQTFIARLYKEAEEKLGPPPNNCRYCVVALGSLARKESGPYPDYDNFIIIENESDETKRYFTQLNQHVADRIVRLGEEKGFHLCEGNLNSPYQQYHYRYANDKTVGLGGRLDLLTSPNNIQVQLHDIMDSAPITGDKALYEEYMNLVFEKEAKANVDGINIVALKNIKRNIDGINEDRTLSPITAPKIPEMIHIKEQLFRFPQATITALAIYHGIKEKNSILRIKELQKQGIFSAAFAARLTTAIEHLIRFRVQAQAAHGEELEFVSTGDWESFNKNNETIKAKLKEIGIDNEKKEHYQNLLNPKIAKNQYPNQVNSRRPDVAAFTKSDKILLEETILPTLRDLFEMASESIKSGKLDPTAFSQNTR